jgi:hypothetical protein
LLRFADEGFGSRDEPSQGGADASLCRATVVWSHSSAEVRSSEVHSLEPKEKDECLNEQCLRELQQSQEDDERCEGLSWSWGRREHEPCFGLWDTLWELELCCSVLNKCDHFEVSWIFLRSFSYILKNQN